MATDKERIEALEDKTEQMNKAFKLMAGTHILNAAASQQRTENMHDQAQLDADNSRKARKMLANMEGKSTDVET